ncbi:hypothetical protein SCH01S_48_00130 [Sphingomonas changbaiensis NBRC 104936]|uniref:DUF3035 domain-containing protein n=1 Tax=Sphingomonas changbaiensis NBRC 104936 TaxID=1219043 RepID=A0A0E9MT92_9SPHN|nr:DUF3035 domain-containing protein [Sphingomonas changbaiensis]GAO40355.1 hypothetical protein SCH01S_48_00130 [Sphingomonas changbaiensis NBRC 104936]
MRNVIVLAVAGLTLAGCGGGGLNRARPDEFAVARRAPLVVPPDFALAPPKPGAPRPQEADSSTQALQAMFGGPAPRSAPEQATLGNAGASNAVPGIRSEVGSPATTAVDKGAVTRDIIAAPEGDGQDARASTTAVTPAPAATPTPEPSPSPTPQS